MAPFPIPRLLRHLLTVTKAPLSRLLLLGLLLGLVALPQPCAACSCGHLPPTEKAAAADVVFRGRVIAVTPGGIRFRVDAGWKGVVSHEMMARPDNAWGQCGDRFVPGEEYLVYAYGRSPEGLTIRSCAGTRAVRQADADPWLHADLAFLGPGTPVTPPVPSSEALAGASEQPPLWPPVMLSAILALLVGVALALRYRWPGRAG